jgi:hypothetical protein
VGLLPQVNTFFLYLLEQIEMHVFGGNGEFFFIMSVLMFMLLITGTTSLGAAVFTVFRSCLAVALLYGFCYAGIQEDQKKVWTGMFCNLCSVKFHIFFCSWSRMHTATIPHMLSFLSIVAFWSLCPII